MVEYAWFDDYADDAEDTFWNGRYVSGAGVGLNVKRDCH